jgi:hypothetical protein
VYSLLKFKMTGGRWNSSQGDGGKARLHHAFQQNVKKEAAAAGKAARCLKCHSARVFAERVALGETQLGEKAANGNRTHVREDPLCVRHKSHKWVSGSAGGAGGAAAAGGAGGAGGAGAAGDAGGAGGAGAAGGSAPDVYPLTLMSQHEINLHKASHPIKYVGPGPISWCNIDTPITVADTRVQMILGASAGGASGGTLEIQPPPTTAVATAAQVDSQDTSGSIDSSMVGRCRLTVSKPELKARLVSALETKM